MTKIAVYRVKLAVQGLELQEKLDQICEDLELHFGSNKEAQALISFFREQSALLLKRTLVNLQNVMEET